MRTLSPLLVLVLSVWPALPSEPYQVDIKQKTFAEHGGDIDHLEPVRQLVPQGDYIAQFIESPSFTKGTYLALAKSQDGKYVLQLTTIPPDSCPKDKPKPETELEIPVSLAEVVYQTWVNALLEVRYDRKSYGGYDGTRYTFSSFVRGLGVMHGSIWSPEANLPPRWLVDSAHELIAFVRDPKRDPTKTGASLTATRDKLFAYLKDHGKH
jgi:hypothetical protein